MLDVLNAANIEMELTYSKNKSILIEGKETCRIPVPVERCPLIRDEDEDKAVSLLDRCKRHLVNQVSLEYNLIGSVESKGVASIGTINWSDTMLNTILMSPLQWRVEFNEKLLAPEKHEYSCTVGDYVTCAISISNCSDHPLK